MKYLIAFLLVLASFSAVQAQDSHNPRIIGGKAASTDYPFFVSILTKYKHSSNGYHWNPFCGASFLGDKFVVTAAHCVVDFKKDNITEIGLLMGDYSDYFSPELCSEDDKNYRCTTQSALNGNTTGFYKTGWAAYTGNESEIIKVQVTPETIFWHEDYDANTISHDVAIIVLPTASAKTPIQLPVVDEFAQLAELGEQVRVIGHGDVISDTDEDTFKQSSQLLEVDVQARTPQECERAFYDVETDVMICAGQANEDSCQGDSGGPLFTLADKPTLLGVVSWGPTQCGANERNAYGVYTNVYHFIDWIKANTHLADAVQPDTPITEDNGSSDDSKETEDEDTEEVKPKDETTSSDNPDGSGGSNSPDNSGDTTNPEQGSNLPNNNGQTTQPISVIGSMNSSLLLVLFGLFLRRKVS